MFKVLPQATHALPHERCEYLIKNRLSFSRFSALGRSDAVPDANTIRTFRRALKWLLTESTLQYDITPLN